jgi:hypothetical protein
LTALKYSHNLFIYRSSFRSYYIYTSLSASRFHFQLVFTSLKAVKYSSSYVQIETLFSEFSSVNSLPRSSTDQSTWYLLIAAFYQLNSRCIYRTTPNERNHVNGPAYRVLQKMTQHLFDCTRLRTPTSLTVNTDRPLAKRKRYPTANHIDILHCHATFDLRVPKRPAQRESDSPAPNLTCRGSCRKKKISASTR